MRFADVAPAGGDAEHAAAIGEDARAVALGAGVENLYLRIGGGFIETLDLGAVRNRRRDSRSPP